MINESDPFIQKLIAAIKAEPMLSNGVFSKRFGIRVESIRKYRRYVHGI